MVVCMGSSYCSVDIPHSHFFRPDSLLHSGLLTASHARTGRFRMIRNVTMDTHKCSYGSHKVAQQPMYTLGFRWRWLCRFGYIDTRIEYPELALFRN